MKVSRMKRSKGNKRFELIIGIPSFLLNGIKWWWEKFRKI